MANKVLKTLRFPNNNNIYYPLPIVDTTFNTNLLQVINGEWVAAPDNNIKFTQQTLTDKNQEQARNNINAVNRSGDNMSGDLNIGDNINLKTTGEVYLSQVSLNNSDFTIIPDSDRALLFQNNEYSLKITPKDSSFVISNLATPETATDAANKQYVDESFRANDAMLFKGVLGADTAELPNPHQTGWTYKVGVAGSYAGQWCEPGDTIYCITDGDAENNADWTVLEYNQEGLVIRATDDRALAVGSEDSPVFVQSNGIVKATTKKFSDYLPLAGGTLTGTLTVPEFANMGGENYNNCYYKKKFAAMSAGTNYADLPSDKKDGTYHRMWRMRFPANCNFWGKIKITLFGTYSSFNASGVMSKSITCNFNGGNIYNNVGYYTDLGVNVEEDYRISEAIWNADVNSWEILIWQKNLSGNNNCNLMIEAWTSNAQYISSIKGITVQPVEFVQDTAYTASRATGTGGTKTVQWATKPVYETPLGYEVATANNFLRLSGGTLTGALSVGGKASIGTDGYITGTWLKTTSVSNKGAQTGKVAVIDDAGWIYYRTPQEILEEAGGGNAVAKRYTVVATEGQTSITFPTTFADTDTLAVYHNGLLLTPTTNYEINADGTGITLGYAAEAGDIFTFAGALDLTDFTDINAKKGETVAVAGASVINIPFTITSTTGLAVFENGILISEGNQYTATTTAITLIGYTASEGDIYTFMSDRTLAGENVAPVASSVGLNSSAFSGITTVQGALEDLKTNAIATGGEAEVSTLKLTSVSTTSSMGSYVPVLNSSKQLVGMSPANFLTGFTGQTTTTSSGSKSLRNIMYKTSAPTSSEGNNGDICIVYTA